MATKKFSKSEKVQLAIILLATSTIILTFIYRTFFAHVYDFEANFTQRKIANNLDFATNMLTNFAFLALIFSIQKLQFGYFFGSNSELPDEFEKAKNREVLENSIRLFLVLIATIFVIFSFSNGAIERLYDPTFKPSEEYFMKALSSEINRAENIKLAKKFSISDTRHIFFSGFLMTLQCLAASILCSRLLVWLKYR